MHAEPSPEWWCRPMRWRIYDACSLSVLSLAEWQQEQQQPSQPVREKMGEKFMSLGRAPEETKKLWTLMKIVIHSSSEDAASKKERTRQRKWAIWNIFPQDVAFHLGRHNLCRNEELSAGHCRLIEVAGGCWWRPRMARKSDSRSFVRLIKLKRQEVI